MLKKILGKSSGMFIRNSRDVNHDRIMVEVHMLQHLACTVISNRKKIAKKKEKANIIFIIIFIISNRTFLSRCLKIKTSAERVFWKQLLAV